MASYRIVRRNTITSHLVEHDRKRIDSAKLLFEREVYEALKANGYLDTRHGHETMAVARYMEEGQSLRVGSYVMTWWRYA